SREVTPLPPAKGRRPSKGGEGSGVGEVPSNAAMAVPASSGPTAAPIVAPPASAARKPAFLGLRPEPLLTAPTPVSIFLAWYAIARFRVVPELFVPHPVSVWETFWEIATEGYRGGTLAGHLADSLYRVVAGFLLAVVTAVPLGLVIGYSTRVQAVFDPL